MNEEARERYFTEIALCLRRKGFEVRNTLGNELEVFEDGELLCKVAGPNGISYRQNWIGTAEREKTKDV